MSDFRKTSIEKKKPRKKNLVGLFFIETDNLHTETNAVDVFVDWAEESQCDDT